MVLARWLATAPRLLMLDEPTRGIDIAARQEIMAEILRLAREGMAVLFISAELEELTRLCDRIAVLRDRRKVGELPAGSDGRQVLELIAGAALMRRLLAHPLFWPLAALALLLLANGLFNPGFLALQSAMAICTATSSTSPIAPRHWRWSPWA